MRSVAAISEKFLEMPGFEVSLEKEHKIYGVGEFGVDSYLIFVKGVGAELTPSDRNLRAFTTWLKQGAPGGRGRVPSAPPIKTENSEEQCPPAPPVSNPNTFDIAARIKAEPTY